MYDTIDKQTVMIECLTLYMNYFKTYFSLVYQQIDCYVNHAKSIINSNNNIVNLSSPSLISTNNNNNSNRISYPKFTYSPFNLPVTQPYSKSYIDRFHMRIIQYLEYRLVNVINKSLNKNQDQIFILVRGFINSLNKVFLFKVNNQYQNNRQQKQFKLNHKGLHIPSIGSLFLEIEHCIKSFFQGIFRYLQNICLKDLQILQQLKSLKNKIFTQIFSPFHQYLIGFQNQSTQTSQYNDTQNQKFYQSNNIILNNKNQQKKSSYKIQQSYRSFLNSKRSQSLGKNMTELKNNINAQKNNSQQYEFFSSSYEQKQIIEQKKDSYADLLSIMQIQTIDIYSREYIMRELKAKNMKNKLSIGKFVKLYKKKQKRHQQNKKISLQNNIHKQQQCYSLTGSVQCVGDGNDTNQLQSTDDNNESKNNLYSLKQKIVVISSSNTNKDQQKKADSLLQRQKIIVSINEIGKNNSKDNIDSNNNNNSDHFIQQKLTPNRIHYSSNNQNPKKHDTLRHIPCVIKNNPITKNNPQLLQLTKDAFLYKQKEKLYFEQLKSKFNNIKNNSNNNSNTNRFQKVSSSSISSISSLPKQMIKRDCIQLEMLKRVNVSNINSQRRLISQYLQETKQQKQSQRNLTKRPTIKGPNFSSFIVVLNNNNNNENNSNKNNNNNNNKNNNNNNNKNNNNKNKTNNKQINYNYYSERQCHSNSQLLSKNHLLLQNINNSQQTLYMLQGSSVQKLLHANKKRKQVSLLQQKQQKHHYQQQSSSSIVKNYNNLKTSYKRQQQTVIKSNNNNAIKMKKNNNGEIQDAAVVMLPRIVVAKLKTITRKNNNII